MNITSVGWILSVTLSLLVSDCCMAGQAIRRLKDKETAPPGNGVLLFSQIKTDAMDPI